jgi:fatty acid amide hydrolase
VCGLKPTSGRLTLDGCLFNLRGMEAFVAQAGPIARTVDDLSLAMRVLTAPGLEAFDPQVPPVPWSDPSSVSIRGLRVAMWTDDGYFRPSPAVRRSVDLAAEALRRRGAIVEPFAPPDVHQAMRLYFHLISADGAADGMRMLGDSPKEPQVRQLIRLGRLPRHLRPLLARLMEFAGRGREADMVRSTGALTADEYWRLTHERAQYAKLFQRTLDAGRFDAMLCPPHGLPALTHGGFSAAPGAWSYCVVFNLLGVPAGVVPATIVGRREESDRTNVREASERGAMRVERHSAGLPVGVQVAGRWWREDVVLALLSAIEDDLRTRPDYPGFPPL